LIVGCGQLGSRHLQAIAGLPEVAQVEVYDPNPDAIRLGQQRLNEIRDRCVDDFCWLSDLEKASPAGDLCIIATRADVRCRVVREIATKLDYHSFLLEKIVAQSVRDYDELLAFCRQRRLSAWVNCKTRAHTSHQRIKSKLNPNFPIVFTALGGNHGLANNGIHAADLFVFYDETDKIEFLGGQIDSQIHSSKRGSDIFDLSGTIYGSSRKGSQFMLSFGNHDCPGCFSILSPTYRAVVDDMMKWFYESSLESGWEWRQVPFDANLLVSSMTRVFVRDILAKDQCELPTLEQCYPAHEFILKALQPRFTELLGMQDHCPVT
jgi:predicted dehydrogenase